MKYLLAILLISVSFGSMTVFAGDRYRQNVYMFPDEIINNFQQDCSNNAPVKPSKFYYPDQNQPNFRPQQQQQNTPSFKRFSNNVAYVSDLYESQSENVRSYRSMTYPNNSRRRINTNYVNKQSNQYLLEESERFTNNFPINRNYQASQLLYASDLEPKKYSGIRYRNNNQYIQREQIRYIPVPVYVYNKPDDIHRSEYSTRYSVRNRYNSPISRLERQNIAFDPYSDVDLSDEVYLQNNNTDLYDYDGLESTSLPEFGIFSSLKDQHLMDNAIDKYSHFSANDDFNQPRSLLKSNFPANNLFSDFPYNLNP